MHHAILPGLRESEKADSPNIELYFCHFRDSCYSYDVEVFFFMIYLNFQVVIVCVCVSGIAYGSSSCRFFYEKTTVRRSMCNCMYNLIAPTSRTFMQSHIYKFIYNVSVSFCFQKTKKRKFSNC